MDANGCVALPYATTACFGANLEQCRLLHSARDHATIDCVSLVRRASSEHSAMQKARPLFTAKHAHTHSRKSRLRWAVVAPLLGRDSPVGPHPRNASSKRNRRKAGSACAGEMGACVHGACNKVRQHTGRLVFFCQKKSNIKKKSRLRRTSWGMPPDPPGAPISLLRMGRGG